jgi:hypothetical protein
MKKNTLGFAGHLILIAKRYQDDTRRFLFGQLQIVFKSVAMTAFSAVSVQTPKPYGMSATPGHIPSKVTLSEQCPQRPSV